MQGRPIVRALSNKSRTAFSDAPMYLLSNSGPRMDMNPSPSSDAAAWANNVLPLPGGPYSRIARGKRIGEAWKGKGRGGG